MKKSCFKGCFCSKAFTLIELLVVVLIIGILAAVAVPQYQKAVMKSRYAMLKELTHSLDTAQRIYHLANDTYAHSFDELDIQMPLSTDTERLDEHTTDQYNYPWGYCRIRFNDSNVLQSECSNTNISMGYMIGEDGRSQCLVYGSKNPADYPTQSEICRTDTGHAEQTSPGTFDGVKYVRWEYLN